MTSFITAVAKDPVFYNIHMFMDNLYEKYYRKLPAYSSEEVRAGILSRLHEALSVLCDSLNMSLVSRCYRWTA